MHQSLNYLLILPSSKNLLYLDYFLLSIDFINSISNSLYSYNNKEDELYILIYIVDIIIIDKNFIKTK